MPFPIGDPAALLYNNLLLSHNLGSVVILYYVFYVKVLNFWLLLFLVYDSFHLLDIFALCVFGGLFTDLFLVSRFS